jgi:ubiquinone/menaquinone biosynthesis C-methylase UbiE
MVGCGNSKMSEEMAMDDGYLNLTNMDISHIVLEKMRVHTDKEKFKKCHGFQNIAMDATKMNFRDGVFDIVIDKGTYDALACDETDKTMIRNLTQEMMRVCRKGGAVVIITNGIPLKRMTDLEEFTSSYSVKIQHSKIELSKLSQMINIMRSSLGNKPLSHVMKDTAVLKSTLEEMVRIEKIKKEEAMLANPKTKIFGMMLKASRL